jgi:hypothetical protein
MQRCDSFDVNATARAREWGSVRGVLKSEQQTEATDRLDAAQQGGLVAGSKLP